jgi:hypothetical protein
LPGEVVEFVALQVPAADLAAYEWTGRTIEYHRAQIRKHLGFRECSVDDAENLTDWARRTETLHAAYAANPCRFVNRKPSPPKLPTAAWINKPTIENDAQKKS